MIARTKPRTGSRGLIDEPTHVDRDELLDAWRANERANLKVLALCEDADFDLKPGKGKTIRSNFTHLVSVRRMWIEGSMGPEAATIPKLDWKTADRALIAEGLRVSNDGMLAYFARRLDLNKPTLAFFAYAVAHEAHHRSQIEIALRINGREPDDKRLYDLWEWL